MRSVEAAPGQAARGSAYAQLSRQVREAGLLDRHIGLYGVRIAVTFGLLGAGWAAFVLVGDSWWQLGVAAFLAIMFAQVGFLGHDAGHRQVAASARVNYILGVIAGNLAIGLSYGWWVDKHNRHHAHPNTEGADPDVMLKVLAFTPEQARTARGLSRLVFRYQAYLFLPMLLLEGASIHVLSVRALASRLTTARWDNPAGPHRVAEAVLIGVHLAGYLTVVALVLSPVRALAFIGAQQALFGLYMGLSFAPNHKGMPVLARADKTDFLRRQVLTSRNVRGGWLTDLALGGLNYQIEHHLFPSMPRPKLRRSQPLVEAFCLSHDLPYSQASLLGSYAQALAHLNEIGKQKPAPAPAVLLGGVS